MNNYCVNVQYFNIKACMLTSSLSLCLGKGNEEFCAIGFLLKILLH